MRKNNLRATQSWQETSAILEVQLVKLEEERYTTTVVRTWLTVKKGGKEPEERTQSRE